MRHGLLEVGARRELLLYVAHKTIEAAKAFELFAVAQARGIQRPAQHAERFVISLERHREWMPVFAAMRKCEPSGISEAAGRAVNDLSNQRQRLQRARAQL